jgi:hypothetical protein
MVRCAVDGASRPLGPPAPPLDTPLSPPPSPPPLPPPWSLPVRESPLNLKDGTPYPLEADDEPQQHRGEHDVRQVGAEPLRPPAVWARGLMFGG